MRLIYIIATIAAIVCSPLCTASICVATSTNFKIGPDDSFLGHKMAFADEEFTDVRYYTSNKNEDYIKQIQAMTSGPCSIIIGIVSSRECLIAGPLLKKNKVIGMSASCGHDTIDKYYPYLYSTDRRLSECIDAVTNHINASHEVENIFVFEQATDIFTETEFVQLKHKIIKPFVTIPIGKDAYFDLTKFDDIKGKPITLVFFTYPIQTIKILIELANHDLITKNTSIIYASSLFEYISLFKPIRSILDKSRAVFNLDYVDWKQLKVSDFYQHFVKKYKRDPIDYEVVNYDTTRFAIQCYRKSLLHGQYNRNEFQKCLETTKYEGVAGTISFSQHSSFADHKIHLITTTKRKQE